MRLFFLAGLGLLLTSCVHRSPEFSPAAKANPNAAIFYGRFLVNENKNMYENKLALWLQNMDTKRNVYLYFDPGNPLYAVQVAAGRYRVVGYAAANRAHQSEGHRPFSDDQHMVRLSRPFAVAAGSVTYLGDYSGHATYDGLFMEWNLDSWTNNFIRTSLEFRERYPNLRTTPVASMLELQQEYLN